MVPPRLCSHLEAHDEADAGVNRLVTLHAVVQGAVKQGNQALSSLRGGTTAAGPWQLSALVASAGKGRSRVLQKSIRSGAMTCRLQVRCVTGVGGNMCTRSLQIYHQWWSWCQRRSTGRGCPSAAHSRRLQVIGWKGCRCSARCQCTLPSSHPWPRTECQPQHSAHHSCPECRCGSTLRAEGS